MILLVALPGDRPSPLNERLHLDKPVGKAGDMVIWLSTSVSPAQFEEVRIGLGQQSIRSAAVLSMLPGPDMLWVATEWWGKLVIETKLLDTFGTSLRGWGHRDFYRHRDAELDLTIFEPGPVGATERSREPQPSLERITDASVFQDRLHDESALVLQIDRSVIDRDRKAWFGDLADERVGGANTLLAYTVESTDGTILVPNLALVHLTRETASNSLAEFTRAGKLTVRAVGFGRGQTESGEWYEAGEFQSTRAAFLDNVQDASSDASFAIALEVEAPRDPEIILGSGVVFEQLRLNGIQNLAITAPQTLTIAARQIVPVILPAWCLNRNLAPPRGQPMRLTRLRSNAGRTQDAIWQRIDSALGHAGLLR